MGCRGPRLKVPRLRCQVRCGLLSACVCAALLATLLLLELPSDGRSAARRRSHYAEQCSAPELFHNEVQALAGGEWWLTSAATVLLERVRSLPAGKYRVSQPSAAPSSIERFSRLSFVMPWRDVNVSIPPVHLNMTVGEYIERADYSLLLLLHVLAAVVVGVGGWLLACGPHTIAWRRCPRLQPRAQPRSELRRSVPKLGLRVLFIGSSLVALAIMWANGALSAVLLELPARYETAVAALHSASDEAESAALGLQLELDRAGAGHGAGSNGTSGLGNRGAVGRMGGGSCEASVVVASLQCYAAHLDVMAAGLNATWPVVQQPDLTGSDSGNSTAGSAERVDGGGVSDGQRGDTTGEDGGGATSSGDHTGSAGSTHVAVGDGSFLQALALGNSVREKTTTAVAALLLFLSWLAVLSSTYERPGLLSLCSLFSAWSAAALILAGIGVLLCALLLADLCAVADLGSAEHGMSGGEPGRAAYERQALRLASVHLETDQPAACQALLAGQDHVGAAVIDGVLPVTLPHQSAEGDGGQEEHEEEEARERCGSWLQGHTNNYYDSGVPNEHGSVAEGAQGSTATGLAVANMSGHWPTGLDYINHCTNAGETRTAQSGDDQIKELWLPPSRRTWLRDWLEVVNAARTSAVIDEHASDGGSVPAPGSCEAVGVPYVEAISPLPCREALPVLVTMWLGVISAALILCCTSCVAATSAHSFNADQLWEDAVAEEVKKLMQWYAPATSADVMGSSGSTLAADNEGGPQCAEQRLSGQADGSSQRPLQPPGPDFSFYIPPGRKSGSSSGSRRSLSTIGDSGGSGGDASDVVAVSTAEVRP